MQKVRTGEGVYCLNRSHARPTCFSVRLVVFNFIYFFVVILQVALLALVAESASFSGGEESKQ